MKHSSGVSESPSHGATGHSRSGHSRNIPRSRKTITVMKVIKIFKTVNLHYAPKPPKPHNQSTFILLDTSQ